MDQGIELKAGPKAKEILLLLKEKGPKTPGEIAVELRTDRNAIYQLPSRMRKRDLVLKVGRKYQYAGQASKKVRKS